MSERRDSLVRVWLDLRKGHRTMSDEGLEKDRMTPHAIEEYNDRMGHPMRIDLGVSAVESRAGQYMRRLRRGRWGT